MASRLGYTTVMLVTANAIVSLTLWKAVTAAPVPPIPDFPNSVIVVTPKIVAATFQKVSRRGDPVAVRLFGSPPTSLLEVVKSMNDTQANEAALRLAGVILSEGTTDERIALIEYGEPPHIARVRTGAELNPSGWRVVRITPSAVELIRRSERRILKLD